MIKKLAVIIAGEYRTWDICYKYLFKFFENRAEQIDYYFVTWDVTSYKSRRFAEYKPVTEDDVTQYFSDKNRLVSYKIVNSEDCANSHTYTLKAYLSKIGNILKREVETANDFVYDQVVDTRPDIYFRMSEYWNPFTSLNDSLMILGDENCTGFQMATTASGHLTISDVYQRTTSITHDVISARILDLRSDMSQSFCTSVLAECTHHFIFSTYLQTRGIATLYVPDYAFSVPIRYNISPDFNLDLWPYDHLHDLFRRADTE